MKVSEVKKKIKELQRCLDNVNRLREYFDGRTGAEDCVLSVKLNASPSVRLNVSDYVFS